MRPELVRVSVVFTQKQHRQFKRYAKQNYASFSDFMRNVAMREIERRKHFRCKKCNNGMTYDKEGNLFCDNCGCRDAIEVLVQQPLTRLKTIESNNKEYGGKDVGKKQPTFKGLEPTNCVHCGKLSFSRGDCPSCGKWKSGEKKVNNE